MIRQNYFRWRHLQLLPWQVPKSERFPSGFRALRKTRLKPHFAHFRAFLNIFEQNEWQIRLLSHFYVNFRKVTLATGVPPLNEPFFTCKWYKIQCDTTTSYNVTCLFEDNKGNTANALIAAQRAKQQFILCTKTHDFIPECIANKLTRMQCKSVDQNTLQVGRPECIASQHEERELLVLAVGWEVLVNGELFLSIIWRFILNAYSFFTLCLTLDHSTNFLKL